MIWATSSLRRVARHEIKMLGSIAPQPTRTLDRQRGRRITVFDIATLPGYVSPDLDAIGGPTAPYMKVPVKDYMDMLDISVESRSEPSDEHPKPDNISLELSIRYGSSHERRYDKAFERLQRLQTTRLGRWPSYPFVPDQSRKPK